MRERGSCNGYHANPPDAAAPPSPSVPPIQRFPDAFLRMANVATTITACYSSSAAPPCVTANTACTTYRTVSHVSDNWPSAISRDISHIPCSFPKIKQGGGKHPIQSVSQSVTLWGEYHLRYQGTLDDCGGSKDTRRDIRIIPSIMRLG